jgi:catechol 2,3-dioxygenase-like lactoylglutathione lyase family enzyme
MSATDPGRLVDEFLAGRVTRRELILRLMSVGAAVGGFASAASAFAADDDDPAAEPTFAAKSLDHIALNVTDIPRSRDWYMKHLGLRPMSDSRTSSFLRCDGGSDFVALFKSTTPGMHHYSFAIEKYDQQEAAERLRAAGLTPKLRGSRIYFDDPDGIEVQVSQSR